MQQRLINLEKFETRDEDGKKYLEGYFAVFNKPYNIVHGWVETIAPGAFGKYLSSGEDVKVLWNHDANIVMGSTSNHTAMLREDDIGLFGRVEINEGDRDALNAYARIRRGDVTGCSFGFEIAAQEESWDDDGTYRTKILEVSPLYEVSPCTFPAYKSTSISARDEATKEAAEKFLGEAKKRRREDWKEQMIKRLRGE